MSNIVIDPEFKARIPAVSSDDRSSLEENLRVNGCLDALKVWPQSGGHEILIDGHNRHEICTRLGIPYKTETIDFPSRTHALIWIMQYQLSRRNLKPFVRVELVLALGTLLAQIAKGRQAATSSAAPRNNLGQLQPVPQISGEPGFSPEKNGFSAEANKKLGKAKKEREAETERKLAKDAGTSHDTIHKAKVITAKASEPVKEKLRRGETTINKEYKAIVKNERHAEQVKAVEKAEIPKGKFHVIVADPPWAYESRAADSTHRAANPYPSMSIEQIGEMGVESLAMDDAILWLWTTNAFMVPAHQIAERWGFKVKTILTWAKDRMGTGDWLRGQTEHCLMCVRGTPVVTLTNQTTLLNGPLRQHSRKPDEFYSLVEALCPGKKCELFSREAREGWTAAGAEVEKFSS